MDTVSNRPEVIDDFVTAYEAAKLSGSILLEAQCCSRAGTAYLKLNLREESNVFYGLCIGLCDPTQANSLRYADKAEFQKAQVELHRTEWLVKGRGVIVIADEELEFEFEGQKIELAIDAQGSTGDACNGWVALSALSPAAVIYVSHTHSYSARHLSGAISAMIRQYTI